VIEPIALSTSWNGPSTNLSALLDQHRALGFRRLEAYAHFTPTELRELKSLGREKDVEIGSLHSPCPVPMTPSGERARWMDGLASVDERERTFAVDAIKASIDAAAEVGAHAIVVHLGNTGVISRQRQIFDTIARTGRLSDEHRRLRDQAWSEREKAKGPHLEAALRSIRAIGEHAMGTTVRIGVECRDGYNEIPSIYEFDAVLAATADLPVGYWHDAGHGAKLDYAGFFEHEELLQRHGERLVGMHVHDTLLARDHLAPGMGTTDFAMLARYLRPGSLKTLELHSSVTAEQITSGLEVLERDERFGVREGILIEL
jgi:sugar phosphate isomerase/epimerase